MKRALSGTKRNKAKSAPPPVAKRVASHTKSRSGKPANQQRPLAVSGKSSAGKRKAIKAKGVRKQLAPRKTTTRGRKPVKSSAAKVTRRPKPSRASATRRKTLATVAVRKRLIRRRKPVAALGPMGDLLPAPAARPAVAAPVREKPVRKARRKVARKSEIVLPAFLLEGDEPSYPATGPGEKFSLGPTPPLDHFDEAKAPLPESYGTGRLFLTARDPHWLYAHWDFTMQEQFRYNAQSVDRHMVLRLRAADQPSAQISEIHVHPESRHWFAHVQTAGKQYVAEIGYYQAGHKWKSLATSAPQRTPPDNISADAIIEFATIPLELPFATMLALLKGAPAGTAENLPLARGLEQLRGAARAPIPQGAGAEWTPEQEAALARLLAASAAGPALSSSGEFVAERSWPEFAIESESGDAGGLPVPSSYVSSFLGGADQQDFRFNVNAELVVYGATEPNATVTFAGKAIPLRADGSFRCHFALPDGTYELPVTAVSADGTAGRAAALKFTRATEIRGDVGVHPPAPTLRPPPKTG